MTPDQTSAIRDRQEELGQVVECVRQGAQVLLVAMPTMGKSRLLAEVSRGVRERLPAGELARLEVGPPVQVIGSAGGEAAHLAGLWPQMFPGVPWPGNLAEGAAAVAEALRTAGRSRVLLLDGADRLDADNARDLRTLLREVNQRLGADGLHVALVATSRREIAAFQGIHPAPKFHKLLLQNYDEQTLMQLVADEAQRLGVCESGDGARALGQAFWEATAGAPGLLESALQWLPQSGLGQTAQQATQASPASQISVEECAAALMQQVVEPYVRNVLLAPELLLPEGFCVGLGESERQGFFQACVTLLLSLSAFRLTTRSHIHLLADRRLAAAQPGLAEAIKVIRAAGKHPYEVFEHLTVVEPGERLWRSLYPAVRRLYFRFGYPSNESQFAAHQEAKELYGAFTEPLSIPSQVRLGRERLWHTAECLRRSPAPVDSAAARTQLLTVVEKVLAPLPGKARGLFVAGLQGDGEALDVLEAVAPGLTAELLQGKAVAS